MPGCDLHISIDDIAVVTGQTATAIHSVMIPDLPALIGVHFYQQALVPDAGAGNAAAPSRVITSGVSAGES